MGVPLLDRLLRPDGPRPAGPVDDPWPAPPRWRTARRGVRRAVRRHRRLLAAGLLAVAVVAGLRSVAPPPAPTAPVLVAGADLAAGEVLAPDDLAVVDVPLTDPGPPDGALVAAGPAIGRTLAAPLRRGEAVTDVRLVQPSLLDGYPGLVAVPVRVPDAGAVALLAVGDRVDLVATDPRAGTSTVVAAAAPVLALPADEPSAGAGSSPGGALVVLGASPSAAPMLAGAGATAQLAVALVG